MRFIFAPYSANDWYRGIWYHGGILSARFLWHWRHSPYKLKFQSLVREQASVANRVQKIAESGNIKLS